MKLAKAYRFRGWQALDYLGGLFLGLIASAVAMLLFQHIWYALYLASGAGAVLLAAFLVIAYVAVMFDDDTDGIDASRVIVRKPKR